MIHPMKMALFALLLLTASCAQGGWDDYAEYVVADSAHTRGGIRVTYLGVAGYQFETGGHALLVDPYFSRVDLCAVTFNQRVEPDEFYLREGLAHVRSRVDAVLVTHAHIDHLLDVPPIMRRTGARLVAGPPAVNQARALGISAAGQTKGLGGR
jgi:L-ascorbate metabolism protein UlaG (beta-lactamase superfamily)